MLNNSSKCNESYCVRKRSTLHNSTMCQLFCNLMMETATNVKGNEIHSGNDVIISQFRTWFEVTNDHG